MCAKIITKENSQNYKIAPVRFCRRNTSYYFIVPTVWPTRGSLQSFWRTCQLVCSLDVQGYGLAVKMTDQFSARRKQSSEIFIVSFHVCSFCINVCSLTCISLLICFPQLNLLTKLVENLFSFFFASPHLLLEIFCHFFPHSLFVWKKNPTFLSISWRFKIVLSLCSIQSQCSRLFYRQTKINFWQLQ